MLPHKRLCLWVCGVLLCGLILEVVSGPTAAQEAPSEVPESIEVFGPSSRTLGGPGAFTGQCGVTRTLFSIHEPRLLCATVENRGQCKVELRLEEGSLSGDKREAEIEPGETETVCNVAQVVKVECKGKEEDMTCKYRWRVDDGDAVSSP